MPGPRLKKIAFLAPRPGMDLPTFFRYWREVHGPTVAAAPDYSTYRTRYAQNHNLGAGPVGKPFPHPGAAIFHLPGDGSNEAEFSRSPTYRDHIRVDELNFIDMDRTLSMAAVETVLLPGTGPSKLLIIGRRRGGMARADFDQRLIAAATQALRDAPDFTARLRGWALNHIVENSFSLPGARAVDGNEIDCIQELWFSSDADMDAAFACAGFRTHAQPAVQGLFAPASLNAFRAREIVFFDANNPIPPPA